MRTIVAVGVVAALAWVAPPAGADAPRSLGEVAAKEKDKKKGKVYTEDDLRNPRRHGTVSQPGQGNTSTEASAAKKEGDKPATAGEKPKTADQERDEAQTAWRAKLAQAQSDVTNWTGEVARIQSVVNDSTAPMYGPGRAARMDSLENAKRQLAAAHATLESVQEEGRRNRYQ